MIKSLLRKIRYYIYRFRWRYCPPANHPLHIDVELTTKCKSKCKVCYRHKYPQADKDMDYGDALYALTSAAVAGVKSVKFNWRGEPMLSKHLLALASWARSMGFVDVMINTRMTEPLKGRAKAFMRLFDTLKVSLDTMKGVRKVVIANLLELQKYGRVTIQRTVYAGLEDDERFKFSLRQAGIKRFKLISRPARNRGSGGLDGGQRKYCGQTSRRLVVDVDLDVWACCCSYTQDQGLHLGNLLESSLLEIWHSDKRAALDEALKAGAYSITETCKQCPCSDGWKA